MPKHFDVAASWLSDPKLVTRHSSLVTSPSAKGWERRFTADTSRAAEAMELYAQLGYEVRTEAVRSKEHTEEHGDECEGCCSSVTLEFKTIYTRKKKT